MNYIKAALLMIALLGVGAFWMCVSLFALLIQWFAPSLARYLNRGFLQSFGWFTRMIVGVKIEVLHPERMVEQRPAVLIGNHQTALDLAIIGSVCPTGTVIVAKKEIQYIPLFGWFFKIAGNIMINRTKSEDAKNLINEVAQSLIRKNLNLTIFPEGTRNRNPSLDAGLLPFKKGAFFLAANTGLPIIPVVCSSLRGKAIWEDFELKGGNVVISVLPLVETKGLTRPQLEELRTTIWNRMSEELVRINRLAQ